MSLLKTLADWWSPRRLNVSQRFDLDRQSTSGTMSTFYRARDRTTGEIFGLKLLDLDQLASFRRHFAGLAQPTEGEIGLAIRHPRVVRTLETGETTDRRPYILLEYLDAPGLHELLATHDPRLAGRRVTLVRWAAEAVAAVHQAGYLHRDICPRNFLVGRELDWLKLIDLGLAIPATPAFLARPNRTGVPRYLAPEILRLRPIDHRADLFSLGLVAYEILTGHHPWPTTDVTGQAAVAHDTTPATDIRTHEPALDARLANLVMQTLAPNPADRPRDVADFLRQLQSIPEPTFHA